MRRRLSTLVKNRAASAPTIFRVQACEKRQGQQHKRPASTFLVDTHTTFGHDLIISHGCISWNKRWWLRDLLLIQQPHGQDNYPANLPTSKGAGQIITNISRSLAQWVLKGASQRIAKSTPDVLKFLLVRSGYLADLICKPS